MQDKLRDLHMLVRAGGLSRRDFLQYAMATGATLAAADVMLDTARAAAGPKRGGLFRAGLGSGSTTDSLDPATWANNFTADMGLGIHGEMLFELNEKNEPVPNLVESWDRDDKARIWSLKLKKGIVFHNGRPLKAKDVVASLDHHRGKKSKWAIKPALALIEKIRVDDDHTIVLELKSSNADFLYILTDYHLPILPAKDDGSLDWASGIGTGPFVIEKFEPGRRLKAKRNPNYHGNVWFDAVEVLVIHDVVARTAALTAGEIHYMDRCDLKTLHLLRRNPNIEITDITSLSHYTAPMNCTVAPFNDVNVRRALKYAINREEILKKVLFGHGRAGNDNPLAPSLKYAIEPQPVHAYDPDKARHYLKKAGLSELKVDLSASDAPFAGAIDAAQIMRESAKAAGIDINVVREPADGYWSNVWMKKPWCFSQWGGRPTADWMLTTAYASDAPWNESYWKNARFDELLTAARSETDETKRAGMYAEMQQLIHDDGGEIVLMFNNFVSATSKKIGHGPINSNYDHDGGYMYKKWWFV